MQSAMIKYPMLYLLDRYRLGTCTILPAALSTSGWRLPDSLLLQPTAQWIILKAQAQ
jgi:hypothetical protein